jgi:hypothetical protein
MLWVITEWDRSVTTVGTVVPAVILLDFLTQVRLVDAAMEYTHFLTGIARIRPSARRSCGPLRRLSPDLHRGHLCLQ